MRNQLFASVLTLCVTAFLVLLISLEFRYRDRTDQLRAQCIHEGHNAAECNEIFHR